MEPTAFRLKRYNLPILAKSLQLHNSLVDCARELFKLEVDRYIGLADIIDWYLRFADISVSAKMADFIGIGLSRCWQNAVISLTHPDNLRKKAQRTKWRQLSCSNASRCVFIKKRQDEPWITCGPSQPKQKHHH